MSVVLLIGAVVGFGASDAATRSAHAQAATATPAPAATAPARARTQHLPPQLAFLASETPAQRFDHFLSMQATFQNPQGQEILVNAFPGKVVTSTANSLTLDVNGPAPERTFTVTSNTLVTTAPRRGTLSAFNKGDRVVVFAIDGNSDALAVVEPRLAAPWMMAMGGTMAGGHASAATPVPTTAPTS